MKTNPVLLLILGTLFFGLANLIFHEWSDWNLGLILGKFYGVDFNAGPKNFPDYIVLNSLYGGPRFGSVKLLQIFLVLCFAGYFTTKVILNKFVYKKRNVKVVAAALILWGLKIPLPVKLSNLPALYDGLVAW